MAAKVMFVIFRRSDLTRDPCLDQWKGERHGALVRKTPGLRKWTQNHVASEEGERTPGGIGELWFDHMDALQAGMKSPRWVPPLRMRNTFSTWTRPTLSSSTKRVSSAETRFRFPWLNGQTC